MSCCFRFRSVKDTYKNILDMNLPFAEDLLVNIRAGLYLILTSLTPCLTYEITFFDYYLYCFSDKERIWIMCSYMIYVIYGYSERDLTWTSILLDYITSWFICNNPSVISLVDCYGKLEFFFNFLIGQI